MKRYNTHFKTFKNTKVIVILAILLVCFLSCITTCRFFVDHAEILRRDGVVVIPNSFPRIVRQQAWSSILQSFGHCQGRIRGDINQSSNKRFDIALTLTPSIQRIVRYVCRKYEHIWTGHLETQNPRLVELSALITFPGAMDQDWHRDVGNTSKYAKLLSIGVALQEITSEMAPLEVVKGTHLDDDDVDDEYGTLSEKLVCSKDTIVAWDGGVYHRGSRNTSDVPRIVLYFTLAQDTKRLPPGSTYTIQKEYTKPYLRLHNL